MNIFFSHIISNWPSLLFGLMGGLAGTIIVILVSRLVKHKRKSPKLTDFKSIFWKAAIIVIFAAMLMLLFVSFFAGTHKHDISNGIVYIVGFMIFLLVYESIESFSIGNLLSLKKEITDKREQVKKLSAENSELRTQMVSVVRASITNQNYAGVVLGFGDAFLKNVGVQRASTEEIIEEKSIEQTATQEDLTTPDHLNTDSTQVPFNLRLRFQREVDNCIVEKFTKSEGIREDSLKKNVKFAEYENCSDPIMGYRAFFDGYIKRPLEEIFIKSSVTISHYYLIYRLYYMLSIILQYAKANNRSAKLLLLIPDISETYSSYIYPRHHSTKNRQREIDRLQSDFNPAIQNGLFEIVRVPFSEDECKEIVDKIIQQ